MSDSADDQTKLPNPTDQNELISFESDDYGYQVRYPKSLTVEPIEKNSILILDPSSQDVIGNTNFVYISYIPTLTGIEPGEIYNFNEKQFRMLIDTKTADSVDLSGGDQAEWFTYNRLTDKTISGISAMHFINESPWEFPEGTVEERYILETDNGYYLIGEYYKDSPFLNDILETFTLTSL